MNESPEGLAGVELARVDPSSARDRVALDHGRCISDLQSFDGSPSLNEWGRRQFAAAEARTAGYGGVVAASLATGVARSTIQCGLRDLSNPSSVSGVVTRAGGSRPALAAALCSMGHQVSSPTIPGLLERLKYRWRVNRKTLEGTRNPNPGRPVRAHQHRRDGRADSGSAADLNRHQEKGGDRLVQERRQRLSGGGLPRSRQGGSVRVCDITANTGCVSVGIYSDTAQFSVNSIRCWLDLMSRERYPTMSNLMITADCGGPNGSRMRLFKTEPQKLADEAALTLQVYHYPPGTLKWNKIKHRFFCHITEGWRGKPLTSRRVAIEMMAAPTTKTGLTVRYAPDTRDYAKGIKVSGAEMATLNVRSDAFHPEWNYIVSPRLPP